MKIKMPNRQVLLLLSLSFGMYPIASSAYAKTDTVSCEYKYVLEDNDTKHDARKIAFIEAKRRCAEQIGTLLASETVVSSSDVTKDEIRAYSLSVMRTQQVAESFLPSGDGLAVLVKLNAFYDSNLMKTRLKELLSDRGKSQEFKKAQEHILALEQQVGRLQRQLSQAIPDEQITRLREERTRALSEYDTSSRNPDTLNTTTRQYARCGMTMEEVRSVLGASRKTRNVIHGTEMWNYGEKWLVFEQGVVIGILTNESYAYSGKGCNANQLPIRMTTCGGKTCFPDRATVEDSEESVLEAEISRPWRLKFSRVLWSADQRVRKGIKPFLKRLVVSNGFPTFLFVSGS